jgi:SAM-dependent methyltransferase
MKPLIHHNDTDTVRRRTRPFHAAKGRHTMPESAGISPQQKAIIETIFGVEVKLYENEIHIGARHFPVRDGVILLDAEVAPAEHEKNDVIRSFGSEWKTFHALAPEHLQEFDSYFDVVSPDSLEGKSVVDLGCGMGRWSKIMMDRAKPTFLVCVDLSEAIFVARENLRGLDNVVFIKADLERLKFPNFRFDLAFSLGVLHHIPSGIETAVANIHSYADDFLCYLYYNLENRGWAFRALFGLAAVVRNVLSRIRNERVRRGVSWLIAALIYKPFTIIADLAAKCGVNKECVPLNAYCGFSIRRMQQDSYDRFFTTVEHRYSRAAIRKVFTPYWDVIHFSEVQPYWHFLCRQRRD